jgi:hypothetical protein
MATVQEELPQIHLTMNKENEERESWNNVKAEGRM